MPPKGTAGLARSRVSGYRRSPCPPASRHTRVWLGMLMGMDAARKVAEQHAQAVIPRSGRRREISCGPYCRARFLASLGMTRLQGVFQQPARSDILLWLGTRRLQSRAVDEPPAYGGRQHPRLADLERRRFEQILRQHDDVRELARIERAFRLILKLRISGVARVGIKRLFDRHLLMSHPATRRLAVVCLARDGVLDADEGIERDDGPIASEGKARARQIG